MTKYQNDEEQSALFHPVTVQIGLSRPTKKVTANEINAVHRCKCNVYFKQKRRVQKYFLKCPFSISSFIVTD